MPEDNGPIETITNFFVLAGSLSDLSKINFSSLNIRCLKINSEEFLNVCRDTAHIDSPDRTIDIINDIKERFGDDDRLFVLLPIDFSLDYSEDDFFLCIEVLLILFPSDLQIRNIIEFQVIDNQYLFYNSAKEYDFSATGIDDPYENYLFYMEEFLDEINEFINIYQELKQ